MKIMKILQVRRYNSEIAAAKYRASKDRMTGPVNTCRTMFYFSITDRQGYAIKDRERGYVAYNEHSACFGMTPEKAAAKLQGVA